MTEVTTLGQTVYTATFDLTVTDCSGKVLLHTTYDHDAGQDLAAVERAVADAAGAIARPPRRRR
jgi:polyisoprenoid-binding protein YceI